MRRPVWLTIVLVGLAAWPGYGWEGKLTKKSLGDINADGKPEIAIEKEYGGSSAFTDLVVKSANRVVLSAEKGKPITLAGDTADGYKVVGKQIVVWQGDWESVDSKWKPHYYDFTWYGWDKSKGRFAQVREGFTRKPYSYKEAQKLMPILVQKPDKRTIMSKCASFAQDALELAAKKYHHRFAKAVGGNSPSPRNARSYGFNDPRGIYVNINRDGSVEIDTMEG